jgi:hypothetical protein
MAYGKIDKLLWADDQWRKLPLDAHALYAYLVSSPTTDTAGVFPVQLGRWAKAHSDCSVERITAAAKALFEGGWIAVDHDTEEGAIRRYIGDQISAGSNVFYSALGRTLLVQSSVLRRTLLDEIRKLDRVFTEREQTLIDKLARSCGAATATSSSIATEQPSDPRLNAVRTPLERRPTEEEIQREMNW